MSLEIIWRMPYVITILSSHMAQRRYWMKNLFAAIIFEYHMQAIWLAPQMRYLKDSMKKKLNSFEIPIHVIDMKTFGRMNGKQALQDILDAMIED